MTTQAGHGQTRVVTGVDQDEQAVRLARRRPARVGSLTALPFPDCSFDGVFSWYSTIHSPDADLLPILGEVRRVLRPRGVVLVAFQSGSGVRDVSDAYRRRGHDVVLHRYNRTIEDVTRALSSAGMTVVAQLTRAAAPHERDGQAVVIAQL